MMIIQHNLSAMNTAGNSKKARLRKTVSTERLSSGYKLNRAADNAAGLAISEKMRAQIRGLNQGIRNVEDGIGYVQVAEGALSEIQNMLHRMHELSVQAANDTYTEQDRTQINDEVQQLKTEIDRTFKETEFNTIKIWDTDTTNKVQIGTELQQAVKMHTGTDRFTINEMNKGAVAYGNYTLEVMGTDETDPDTYGFRITWTGYNNKDYSTRLISWDETDENYSFSGNISQYLDTYANPDLAGISFTIGWTAVESATLDDVVKCINGTTYPSSISNSESVSSNTVSGVSWSVSIGYLAELVSERDMDAYDTDWIEPRLNTAGTSNVLSAPRYTDTQENTGWTLGFTMPGIGNVTATNTSVSYYSSNSMRIDKYEDIWWYKRNSNGQTYYYIKSYTPAKGSNGTLLGVTDCITDSARTRPAGYEDTEWSDGRSISKDTEKGGTISVTFTLNADSAYTYQYTDYDNNTTSRTSSSNHVGTLTLYISVSHGDTEETIMQRVAAALDQNQSIIDIYEGSASTGKPSSTTAYTYPATAKTNRIETPVYKTTLNRYIQMGANTGQGINLIYDSLRLQNLGVYSTNTLTQKDAEQAIDDVKNASEIISAQRSLFGAYQNRMEYARAVNSTTAENLQAAESKIRDTDMALEAVNLALSSIVEQAAQAMLANANQHTQGILQLLH